MSLNKATARWRLANPYRGCTLPFSRRTKKRMGRAGSFAIPTSLVSEEGCRRDTLSVRFIPAAPQNSWIQAVRVGEP